MNFTRCSTLLFLATLLVAAGSNAQDKKKPEQKPGSFITAADAGPDFLVQGEYAGETAGKKWGAQVVAKGDGNFEVYFLTGGLPGAGWDQKGRIKVNAKTEGAKTSLLGKEWSAFIVEGKLAGTGPAGAFILTRVERQSPTVGAKAPAGAMILFDGSDPGEWKNGKLVEDNLLFCGTASKKGLAAGRLHIEFRTPFEPKKGGQGRGNSGVYVQGNEIQVLDSFGLEGKQNECGAFYGKAKPAVNMCLPPLTWQTYDVDIKTDDKGNTTATVMHNGVKIHDNFVIRTKPPAPTPINLQNHGNWVVYRNIWFVESK